MFTTNFNKILLTLSLNVSGSFIGNYMILNRYPNNLPQPYYISSQTYSKNISILNNYIVLGTGNTEPAENDYKLSGAVISLTNQTTNIVTRGWNKDGSMEILYKVTGTPTSDATINEIGLVKNFYTSDSQNEADVLLAREVLDTPIELTNGVAVELYFRLKFKLT